MIRFRALLSRCLFPLWTGVFALVTLPVLLLPPRASISVQRSWARSVLWMLRVVAGITYEIRGQENLPRGGILIAAKHQSTWDTIIFLLADTPPAFVLKKELLRIPVYGWYCLRTGMVPIDRAGGANAMRAMLRAARARVAEGRPLVIFPEGTRVPPGEHRALQPGVAGLYRQLDMPVVPVALNSGLVWPKSGFRRTDFRITLEYLPPIAPGLPKKEFLAALEKSITEGTNRLMAEGGASPS